MTQARQALKEFTRFSDRYYWLTAFLIAQNAITRQYKNSFLGVVWTVLHPLMQVAILSIVMPLIMRFPVHDYVLYLVTSYPLWSFIATALVKSSQSIISQAETLKRCVVSATVFPVADVLKHFYTYLVSFVTMYGVAALIFGGFNPIVFLLPVYLLPLLVMLMALAVAIAFLAPYMRDIDDLMLVGVSVTFWLTPVVYPIEAVPEKFRWCFWFNPFFIMMHPVYELAYNHRIPGFAATFMLLLLTGVVVAGSYAVYRLCRRNYVYYL